LGAVYIVDKKLFQSCLFNLILSPYVNRHLLFINYMEVQFFWCCISFLLSSFSVNFVCGQLLKPSSILQNRMRRLMVLSTINHV